MESADLDWNGLGWAQLVLDSAWLGWARLGCGLCWYSLGWRLKKAGLGWNLFEGVERGWAGLDWNVLG